MVCKIRPVSKVLAIFPKACNSVDWATIMTYIAVNNNIPFFISINNELISALNLFASFFHNGGCLFFVFSMNMHTFIKQFICFGSVICMNLT